MISLSKWTFVGILFLASAFTITAQIDDKIIESIGKSHIEANVPDRQHFDEYLKRDLAAYFKKTMGKNVSVEYELLRNGPTQTGIAFPKFYAWVIVRENDNLIDQGAVRLAAINKERFDVTHFLSISEVLKHQEAASKTFPADVIKKISNKIGRVNKSEA